MKIKKLEKEENENLFDPDSLGGYRDCTKVAMDYSHYDLLHKILKKV